MSSIKNRAKSTTSKVAPKDTKPVGENAAEMGGGEITAPDPCDINIDVDLEGIRADGLRGLIPGVELSVRLEWSGSLRSAVCVRENGLVVGSLSSFRGISLLLNCLEKGVKYTVTVTRIGTGSCHVQGGRVGP
jgi:hypothetical protein